ncbi:MAG: ATP-binding protein [Planctomycetota bacterium]
MEDLSLHILDIAENSISGSAKTIEIRIDEDRTKDLLTIEIKDDGKGMDEQTLQKALDPFFTTRTTRRVGLGLPLLAQAARESGGGIELDSKPGRGTTVRATFAYGHVDRKPMGDIDETILTLVAGHPEIDILYEHNRNGSIYHFDTRETAKK